MLRIAKTLFDRNLVPNALSQQQDQLLGFIRQCQEIATLLGEPALLGEIDQLSTGALKPFLFVIVGEVKSGKSSLINALLETPVCAVDSAPCTDSVQEINYGEEEQRLQISEFEERLHLPHAILKHICIVDTPGTNSIIRHHQVITENYIPQSDLILFVFFAKNPYTGSAWDFLRYIKHEWQRNTLFVLQQADLLPTAERKRTLEHIREQLVANGIEEPVVFAVSVKTGMGVSALRDYLRSAVVEGRQYTKVQSLLHNILRFVGGVEKLLESHQRLNKHDDMLLGKLHGLTLNMQTESDVDKQVGRMMDECRRRAEEAKRRLRKRFQGKHTFLEKIDTLKNALASGHEVRQWLLEFFGNVQQELTHALYQDQLRYYSALHQRGQELARQMLDLLAARPRHVKKSAQDALTRQREQTLEEIRERLGHLDSIRPEDTVQPQPALGRLNRLLLAYRLLQAGAAVGLLAFGVYFDGLISGLVLGGLGYVGIGYGLFARNRESLQARCILALDQSLEDLEHRLHATLTEHVTEFQQLGEGSIALFERDLKHRLNQTDKLLRTARDLRAAIQHYHHELTPSPEAPKPATETGP
ncbi:MAG: dynamin family protein [Gammaproteobacteria bacterium]